MEMYSELENDSDDVYPGDVNAETAWEEHERPYYNMQMVRHMEEKEDADRNDLIKMGVFKPTSGNATKRLRIWQETHTSENAKATLKQIAT